MGRIDASLQQSRFNWKLTECIHRVGLWFIEHALYLKYYVLFIGVMCALYAFWDVSKSNDALLHIRESCIDADSFIRSHSGRLRFPKSTSLLSDASSIAFYDRWRSGSDGIPHRTGMDRFVHTAVLDLRHSGYTSLSPDTAWRILPSCHLSADLISESKGFLRKCLGRYRSRGTFLTKTVYRLEDRKHAFMAGVLSVLTEHR